MGKILVIKGADFSSVAVAHVTPIADKVAISVVASPAGGGTVTGTGSYDEGAIVTITATAAEGYTFVRWNDGNTNASRQITVGSSSATYTATFAAAEFNLMTELGKLFGLGGFKLSIDQTYISSGAPTGTPANRCAVGLTDFTDILPVTSKIKITPKTGILVVFATCLPDGTDIKFWNTGIDQEKQYGWADAGYIEVTLGTRMALSINIKKSDNSNFDSNVQITDVLDSAEVID